jgi:hypothetical protein
MKASSYFVSVAQDKARALEDLAQKMTESDQTARLRRELRGAIEVAKTDGSEAEAARLRVAVLAEELGFDADFNASRPFGVSAWDGLETQLDESDQAAEGTKSENLLTVQRLLSDFENAQLTASRLERSGFEADQAVIRNLLA